MRGSTHHRKIRFRAGRRRTAGSGQPVRGSTRHRRSAVPPAFTRNTTGSGQPVREPRSPGSSSGSSPVRGSTHHRKATFRTGRRRTTGSGQPVRGSTRHRTGSGQPVRGSTRHQSVPFRLPLFTVHPSTPFGWPKRGSSRGRLNLLFSSGQPMREPRTTGCPD